ncbi:FAD binding domain-containing protein [Pseudonocardia spirodelae]|uniref:FAD binding domain-containing protein n=1 Tax=Pseudonocardia spirodelae TaxID=3133431 RepID=A0ABU8TE96_9PSEU
MKAAPFAYVRPSGLDDVLAELADGDGKVLAGGQSLVPVLAMRLGRPGTLVDINAVEELGGFGRSGDTLQIGAAVRQRTVEHARLSRDVPLLGMAMPFVGHRELRSRGTVCGSLAHADPAAELPAVASCLGATVTVAGPSGRRRVPAAEFVVGAMTTGIGPDEVVTGVELPVARPRQGFGFAEIARRHGDFALAGVVTVVDTDDDGTLRAARLTGFGISDRPVTEDVTDLLRSVLPGDGREDLAARLRPGAGELAARVVDTGGDAHGSTGYRRRLFSVLAARELATAWRKAGSRPS